MFFTQEDYRKIEDYLKRKSIKDTQFDEAITPLDGEEEIAFVQNGKNVKAHVKDIVEQLFLLGVSDFVNITDKYNQSYIDLKEAIDLIPFYSRKKGQVITFINKEGDWVVYQFKGYNTLQWNNTTLWVNTLGNNADIKISGTFSEKPTSDSGVNIGYGYYCIDKQTTEGSRNGIMIYYAGDGTWVDALGRVVS